MSGYLNIEYASLTDVGVRRSHNQDSHAALPAADAAQWDERGHFFVVADGMGAHAVGELASKMAADNIPHIYFKHIKDGAPAALRKSLLDTNTAIHTRGQQNREFEGMGTTGTALVLRPEGAWIGHVGDSRVYRVRKQRIEQLSFDHSLVWELARRQGAKPETLQGIPSNVIVRSLGPEPDVQADVEGPHHIRPGDVYVLCSDGLSGPVSDREIGAVVSTLAPVDACRFLVDLANLQGGPDNVTVIVVKVVSDEPETPSETEKSSWLVGMPWPWASLLVGILLSLAAIGLTYANSTGAGTVVFIIAALALGAGLVGLLWQSRQDGLNMARHDEPSDPRVHRRCLCAIDASLVHKLARAEGTLAGRIRERNWTADWEDNKAHHDKAEKLTADGELKAAFREYCLAMRPLSDAVQRQRQKEEVFQPVWDKFD